MVASNTRSMRPRGRMAGLVTVLATVIAVAATPALAASSASAEEATAPALTVGEPWWQSLDARWNIDGSTPLPSTTTTLTVTVPPELFAFDSAIDAVIVGVERYPVAVTSADAVSGTVSVAIPQGYLASAAPSMTQGYPQFSLGLRTTRPQPAGVVAAPYLVIGDRFQNEQWVKGYYSYGYVSIGFEPGPAGATEHSRTLEKSTALRYLYGEKHWIDPVSELLVRGGETLVVSGGPPVTTPGSSRVSEWWEYGNDGPQPKAAGEGLTIEVADPPRSTGNRSLLVRLDYQSETTSVEIAFPVIYVRDAVAGPGVTTRIASQDRYSGAIAANRRVFDLGDTTRPITNLTSGTTFADSLSAAAATAHVGGSLLLVRPNGDNTNAGAEAARVGSPGLVTVGGPASVPDSTAEEMAWLASTPAPDRIGGKDRYEVSRNTAERFWPTGAPTVFVASGTTFADALSSVPAAATQQAPVLLVPGAASALDQSTLATLQRLGTQRVVIVGGPVSVSPGIEKQLAARLPGGVERISGADRFDVSAAVNTRFFPTAEEAFVATGATFADALTGGVLAASRNAPLLLVRPDCVPASAHAALTRWNVSRTTLLGGPASLGESVEDLVRCR
jgi:putative cell wall-binding protein